MITSTVDLDIAIRRIGEKLGCSVQVYRKPPAVAFDEFDLAVGGLSREKLMTVLDTLAQIVPQEKSEPVTYNRFANLDLGQ